MKRATTAIVGAALAVAGCGSGASGSAEHMTTAAQTTAGKPATPAKTPKPRGLQVKLARSAYGRILFAGNGRALYLFTRDAKGKSRCSGACAASWPPALTKAAPVAGSGVQKPLLGTALRSDGRSQLTYAGHPLYYYVGDKKPGQVLCQNVDEFGGTWLVVSGAGNAVK